MTQQNAGDGHFEVYWPRGPLRAQRKQLAPRSSSLDGKHVAFLWDYLFRGNEMFETLQEELSKRYKNMRFMHWDEIGNIHGTDERRIVAELPGRLKAAGVDAVITAVAA